MTPEPSAAAAPNNPPNAGSFFFSVPAIPPNGDAEGWAVAERPNIPPSAGAVVAGAPPPPKRPPFVSVIAVG